jgi:hypothetical protein
MSVPRSPRRALLLAAALLSTLAITPAAFAGGAQPLHFEPLVNPQIDNPVEQQTPWVADGGSGPAWLPNDHSLWIPNSTTCTWDIDDHWTEGDVAGTLDPGASVSLRSCEVAESASTQHCIYGTCGWWSNPARWLGISVAAPAALDVSVCYEPQGRCIPVPARWSTANRRYEQTLCASVVYAENDPALTEIAGSNGGVGAATTSTVTITNKGRKQLRQVSAMVERLGFGSSPAPYCDTSQLQRAYPLSWATTT